MEITVNIDDAVLSKAMQLTGIKETNALVRFGLKALISLENSKRLAGLGGTDKSLGVIPRRREI